jgi:hypothetical protein
LPFVGWVILPIWALVSGLGAFVLALKEQRAQFPSMPTAELVTVTPKVA